MSSWNSESLSSKSSSSSENSFVFVEMDSQSRNLLRGDDPYPLPFITRKSDLNYGGKRSKLNFCRFWKSLSRFQRNLLSLFFVLASCSAVFLYITYSKVKLPASGEPQHRKEINEKEYEKSAIFPAPSIPKSQKDTSEGKDTEDQNKPQLAEPNNMPKLKGPENDKQKAVVAAFQHAWTGYRKFAWGKDHLKPVSKSSHTWFGLGLTIVDSLDTLLIMGLKDEFEEAKKWVSESLNFDVKIHVNLFETTIRVLGGLLSAYHLSGERMFVDKATDLGMRLIGAFDTASKIPFSDINLSTRKGKLPGWGAQSSLSEVSSLQLEFRDLSRVSGNPIFEQLAFNVSQHIHRIGCTKMDGLCPMFINPKTGQWHAGYTITLGARADSYYEYLLKQWLQTGKKIDWLRDDYTKAMNAMFAKLMRYSEPNKLTFIGEIVSEKTFSPKMDHLVCFIAGTLALGAVNGFPKEHMDYARQIAHTCYQMYNNPTRLGPEIVHFNMIMTPQKQDLYIKPLDAHSLLRPEAIEAWFHLYRLTGDKIYQEYGWNVFQAMEKYAKVPNGYSSVQNVKRVPPVHKDHMESFFLAETLKYLYLLLADDQSVLPLTEYVFNTEAHPLPIYSS